MKFATTVLLAVHLFTDLIDARRGGKRTRHRHTKVDGTTALCRANLTRGAWDDGLPMGKTIFWQHDAKIDSDGAVVE